MASVASKGMRLQTHSHAAPNTHEEVRNKETACSVEDTLVPHPSRPGPEHVPKYSPMRSEPAKSIPMTLTRVMSFRPVEKPILPDQVNRRITSIMVYIVNPYMHDG